MVNYPHLITLNRRNLLSWGLTCPPKTDPHVKLEWRSEGREGDEQEKAFIGAESAFKTLDNCYDPKLITEPKSSHIQRISSLLDLKYSCRSRR
jgi:hypothetical protein